MATRLSSVQGINPLATDLIWHYGGAHHADNLIVYLEGRREADDETRRLSIRHAAEIRRLRQTLPLFDPNHGIEPPKSLTAKGMATVRQMLQCRDLSIGSSYRQTATRRNWCPRAVPVQRRNGDTVETVFPECRSRTCEVCQERVDDRDIARVGFAFSTTELWIDFIVVEEWRSIATRARRRGAVAVKMSTNRHHDQIVLLSSEPLTDSTQKVADDARDALIRDLVEHRPPGTPPAAKGQQQGRRRPYLSGVGLPSVKDWEAMNGHLPSESDGSPATVRLHPSVTPEALTLAAQQLDIETERHGSTVVFHARWDDPRAAAIRKWGADPERFTLAALKATANAPALEPDGSPGVDRPRLREGLRLLAVSTWLKGWLA